MKSVNVYCPCICAVLLMLTVSKSKVLAQNAPEDHLVGWWLFDSLKDEIGNWGDIALQGARIEDGQ